MYKRRFLTSMIICILFVFTLTGCQEPAQDAYNIDFFAMDTYITCQVWSEDQRLGESGLAKVEQVFLGIDQKTNRFNDKSEIAAVNRNAGIAPVKVSRDVFEMVETALAWSDRTNGAFNILIGSAMDLWGFGSEHPEIPAQADLVQALSKTDYHKIVLDTEQSTIFLPKKGMVMDLGGIAKGYATDRAVAALKQLGIENALINAGGNVYALGTKPPHQSWKVGVQDPRNPQGVAQVLQVSDTAVVSSGDYQRYFEVNGLRYHHILDPATGSPARACAGTTVIMRSAAIADILSTAFFVLGPVQGIELAEKIEEVKAVLILTADGGMSATENINDYLSK